jgi:hypothetical protein
MSPKEWRNPRAGQSAKGVVLHRPSRAVETMREHWPPGSGSLSDEGKQRPAAGDALELVKASVFEPKSAPHDRPPNHVRDEYLTGSGEGAYARSDVHRHAADVGPDQLTLAGVHAHADVDAKFARDRGDGPGTAQGMGWRAIEDGQKAVADRLDLAAAEAQELFAHSLVVLGKEIAPASIAKLRRSGCGCNDVGEHQREQRSRWLSACPFAGEELLDFVDDRVAVTYKNSESTPSSST